MNARFTFTRRNTLLGATTLAAWSLWACAANGMTANHYLFHLRTLWSSVSETVPIGVATPASKHVGVVGASLRGLFPLLMMSGVNIANCAHDVIAAGKTSRRSCCRVLSDSNACSDLKKGDRLALRVNQEAGDRQVRCRRRFPFGPRRSLRSPTRCP
jgi:hypothetical protein